MKSIFLLVMIVLVSSVNVWAETGIAGRTMSLSDVQTIPDSPIGEKTIVTMPKDDFSISFGRLGLHQSIKKEDVPKTALFTLSDSRGYFQQDLESGIYVVCFFPSDVKEEFYQPSACVEVNLSPDEIIRINYEKMFQAYISCDKKEKCQQEK